MNDLTQTPEMLISGMGARARAAAAILATVTDAQKIDALRGAAQALRDQAPQILAANARDVENAAANGLSPAMLDRLRLDEGRVAATAAGVDQVATLDNPLGSVIDKQVRPNGMELSRVRVPLGVIGIIYEARPNVTVDAAGLCLKSGNAAILRGGSESIQCNRALAALVHEGLQAGRLPAAAVQVVETTDRAAVGELITMKEYVDVIVPRGGKGLIERISAEARIPVIKHLDGNCHVYVDDEADLAKALRIVDNAKTQRLGTCNTAESLLVARSIAKDALPQLAKALIAKGVEIRGCDETRALVPQAKPATEEDHYAEYLAAIISVKVVSGLDEAIAHINKYSSQHTDAIVTENYTSARRFLREVDSSSVMVNASTRFADGFEYGLGAEIGISTDKLHARGPVGLEGLTSVKYIVLGNGEVRS